MERQGSVVYLILYVARSQIQASKKIIYIVHTWDKKSPL